MIFWTRTGSSANCDEPQTKPKLRVRLRWERREAPWDRPHCGGGPGPTRKDGDGGRASEGDCDGRGGGAGSPPPKTAAVAAVAASGRGQQAPSAPVGALAVGAGRDRRPRAWQRRGRPHCLRGQFGRQRARRRRGPRWRRRWAPRVPAAASAVSALALAGMESAGRGCWRQRKLGCADQLNLEVSDVCTKIVPENQGH
jgi:hypothetical protein